MEEFVENFNKFKDWLYYEFDKQNKEGSLDKFNEISKVKDMFETYNLHRAF